MTRRWADFESGGTGSAAHADREGATPICGRSFVCTWSWRAENAMRRGDRPQHADSRLPFCR
jgi:hypothetical protein